MIATHCKYLLHLADNALIAGHRNSEWTGHGPALEQDIALSNIALDQIGQARNLFQYAADHYNEHQTICSALISSPVFPQLPQKIDEDDFACLRDANEFYNLLLVEQPNGDWGNTILKQFFFSAFQLVYFQQLLKSTDRHLSAIAEKSLKELKYHVRWSGEWVIRLGDGTAESHQRMATALKLLWPYIGEFFIAAEYEKALVDGGIAVDVTSLEQPWLNIVTDTFLQATLPLPLDSFKQQGGKLGRHSEHLGFLLAEMQFLQRAYPNSEW
jgi:ring-1,2-phenylacetyl-CoA epoxidase subunit PaaC